MDMGSEPAETDAAADAGQPMSESVDAASAPAETPPSAEHEAHSGHDEEIHMPPNSWWPMVTAIGIAIALVGVIFLDVPFVLGIGIIVGLAGLVMWVVDARKEYSELH